MGEKFSKLSMVQAADLLILVREEFVKFGKTDPEFAVMASERLGFPVTGNMVGERRRALGIEATQAKGEGTTRLDKIEEDLKSLRARIDALDERLGQKAALLERQAVRVEELATELEAVRKTVGQLMTYLARGQRP